MNTNKKVIGIIIPAIAAVMMTACDTSISHNNVLLSFKYMSISSQSNETDLSFQDDPDYPDLIATFTVEQNHVISLEDLANIGSLTSFIPHNQGGYYVRTAYYSDYLNPLSGSQLAEGYECITDITFYYSFTGGRAQSPEKVNFSFILLDIIVDSDSEFGFSFIETNTAPIIGIEFDYGKDILQEDMVRIDDEISELLEIDSQSIFGYFPDPSQLSNELRLTIGTQCLYDQDYFFGILD